MSAHDRSNRCCASTCCTHRFVAASVGSDVAGTSSASASEWAASVDSTSVLWPAAALAHAVAAARVDLPTPPLPVNSRIRMPGPRVRATRRAS